MLDSLPMKFTQYLLWFIILFSLVPITTLLAPLVAASNPKSDKRLNPAHHAKLLTGTVSNQLQLISRSNDSLGNGPSHSPSLSADGQAIVYVSRSNNLVVDDTNQCQEQGVTVSCADIFLYDQSTNQTSRISVASNGAQADGDSFSPIISADGERVVFTSHATNLVYDDINGVSDIFLHHRQSGMTRRISLATDSTEANDRSFAPFISADGRYIVFTSMADNLVFGDTNHVGDVFWHDYQTGITKRVSLTIDGQQSQQNSWSMGISGDGQTVLFGTGGDLTDPLHQAGGLFIHHVETSITTQVVTDTTHLGIFAASLSQDGQQLAYQTFNGHWEIIFQNFQTDKPYQVARASNGAIANFDSFSPMISGNGSGIVFSSRATNLTPHVTNGIEQLFVHQPDTGVTMLASQNEANEAGNRKSELPAISADGQYIAFSSLADNLTVDDNNGVADIFIRRVADIPPVELATTSKLNGLDFTEQTMEIGFYINNIAISPNEAMVAIAGTGGVGIYHLPEMSLEEFIYTGPSARVTWSPDSEYVATAGYDGAVPVWYVWTAGKVNLLGLQIKESNYDWSPRADWSPDGAYVASNSIDENVYLWRVISATAEIILNDDGAGEIDELAWSPNGAEIAVSDAKAVRLWDIEMAHSRLLMPTQAYNINDLAWSVDSQQLAFGSHQLETDTHLIHIWSRSAGTAVLEGHQAYVNSVAWSPDGLLASAGDDGLFLWDVALADYQPFKPNLEFTSVDWSASGNYLIGSTSAGTVYLWQR